MPEAKSVLCSILLCILGGIFVYQDGGGGVEGVHPPAVGYILTNCLSIIHILPCNFIPSPAIKAMIVGFGCFPSIISIYLGSRGWVESVDTDIVVIGNVRIF